MKNEPLNKVDYYRTFPEFIDTVAVKYKDKPAVSYYTRQQQEILYTYGEFTSQIYDLREELYRNGYEGKHIAIIGENSYEWLVAYLAIISCGGIAVCIDAEQSDDSIRQMLVQADTDAAFLTDTFVSLTKPVLPEDKMFLLGKKAEGKICTFEEMCTAGHESRMALEEPRSFQASPDQVAVIVFTSGTSSTAKPVMLTHENILHNASDCISFVWTYDRIFAHLPFYHTYGMTGGVLSTLVHGAHSIINGNMRTVMRDLQLSNADSIITVPLMLEAIRNQIWLTAEQNGKTADLKKLFKLATTLQKVGIGPKFKALDEIRQKAFGSVRNIICGGAALDPDVEQELALLGVNVFQGYGITECSPMVSVNRLQNRKLGSVGPVLPTLEVKSVEGEIYIKGITVMPGYYKSPELTAEVMEDGWFKTGDIGYIDNEGFLFITGRKKNLIVFKNGKKVSPEKMEELIGRIPLVKEVVVYGAASGSSAEDIKMAASIYPDPERSEGMSSYDILAKIQEEVDAINAKLPFFQQIQMINIRNQPFAKTASKKIIRHLV